MSKFTLHVIYLEILLAFFTVDKTCLAENIDVVEIELN